MEPAKKTKKSTPKKSVKKSAPVKSGSMGAQILAAMNAKKNNKIMLKSSGEKQGDFDTKSLEATIEMQAHRAKLFRVKPKFHIFYFKFLLNSHFFSKYSP
jgi:hypothetical protein